MVRAVGARRLINGVLIAPSGAFSIVNSTSTPLKKCGRPHALARLCCFALIIAACANSNSAPNTQNVAPVAAQNVAPVAAQNVAPVALSSVADAPPNQNMNVAGEEQSALEALWRQRTASTATSNSGFTLGPGDVLRISVPMIAQLTDRTVRISEDDTIALPLLGVIKVGGMTEQDLRQELAGRLGRYMYNPQVEVYLKTPENRVVSVLGTVRAPGRYLVASRSDTIMTLLSRAGGATDRAGSQILFFPAPPVASGAASGASSRQTTTADGSAGLTAYQLARRDETATPEEENDSKPASVEPAILTDNRQGAPFVISTAGAARYLEMPVRPGDVVFVPAAGSVSVQGWVDKPGLFPITPGMTVLGSVAAAGGALFTSSATLVRGQQGGGQRAISLNLSGIKSGKEPDVLVSGGDVIIVERSVVGAVPYSLYFLVNKVGLGLPLFY
jgi:polysaccharide export outer membrane protein